MFPFITRVHRPRGLLLTPRLSYLVASAVCSFLGLKDSDLGVAGIPDLPPWGRPGWPGGLGWGEVRREFSYPGGPPSPKIRPEINEAHIEVGFSKLHPEIGKWSQVLLGQSCQGVVSFEFCYMTS